MVHFVRQVAVDTAHCCAVLDLLTAIDVSSPMHQLLDHGCQIDDEWKLADNERMVRQDARWFNVYTVQFAASRLNDETNMFPQRWVGPCTCCTMSDDASRSARRRPSGSSRL